MKTKLQLLIAIIFIASSALMAQTGDIVTMKTAITTPISMTVGYTGTGSIIANGVNMSNSEEIFGISPNSDGNIIITATGSIQLNFLVIDSIRLTHLDVSQAIYLWGLYCEYNQLTELDVKSNTALSRLYCGDNQLTKLDVTNNIGLIMLFCQSNQLTELDVTKNTALTQLWCQGNQLTELNVTNNFALGGLHCSSNQLTELNITNNTELKVLFCDSNQLTKLDIRNNTALAWLHCGYNQLTSLDLSNKPNLESLHANSQAIEVAVLDGATTFSNPIYYHNGTEVEHAQIDGTTYAFGSNIDIPASNTLNFTTNNPYEGNPFGGEITFVPGTLVTFVTNGGTEIEPMVVKIGGVIGTVVCKRPSHSIEGWYTEETFENKWNLETDTVTTSMTLYANWILGIDDFAIPALNLYPNPASGSVNISSISAGDIITVNDLSGRKLMQVRATTDEQSIDVSTLRAGVYVVSTNGGRNTKLVVSR